MLTHIFWATYVACFAYTMWRTIKRYSHSSHDGVTGPTPGLDVIAMLVLCIFIAPSDLVSTLYQKWKKKTGRT